MPVGTIFKPLRKNQATTHKTKTTTQAFNKELVMVKFLK